MGIQLKQKSKRFLKKIFLKRVNVVVVCSTGRTGTKFFESIFKILDVNAVVMHEPKPDLFNLSLLKIRNVRTKKFVKDCIIDKRGGLLLNKRDLKQIFLGRKIFIECNPFLFSLIPEYSEIFKQCDIIYVTRDPKTYIISAYNKDPQNDGCPNFYSKFDHRKRLTANDYGEMEKNKWEELHRSAKIAWYWNKCNQTLHKIHQSPSYSSILVKFEELFSEVHEVQIIGWSKVAVFAGYSQSFSKRQNEISITLSRKVNQGKPLSEISKFKDFSRSQQKKIWKFTNLTAKELNY